MTTTATETPRSTGTETHPEDAAPVIKQSAVPTGKAAVDAQAAKLAALAESGRFRSTGRNTHGGDWYSGWCGPTSCRDGKTDPASGDAPRYRCLGLGENGAKITPRYIFCACTCHRTNPLAVPVPEDLDHPNSASIVSADEGDDEGDDE